MKPSEGEILIVNEGKTPQWSTVAEIWPVIAVKPGCLPELAGWMTVTLKRGILRYQGEKTIEAGLRKIAEDGLLTNRAHRPLTPKARAALVAALQSDINGKENQ